PETFGDDVSQRRATVLQVMREGRPVAGIEQGIRELTIFAVAPMREGERVLGTLGAGQQLNRSLVDRLKREFGVDVAIHRMRDNAVETLATTLGAPTGLAADAYRAAQSGSILSELRELNGHPYAIRLAPLRDFSGQPIAVLEIVKDIESL